MKRILVVEDTWHNRRILRDLLTRAGYEVLEAVNGEEGIVQAELHRPDLILMDIQLPVVNGYDATRRIKGLGGRRGQDPRGRLRRVRRQAVQSA